MRLFNNSKERKLQRQSIPHILWRSFLHDINGSLAHLQLEVELLRINDKILLHSDELKGLEYIVSKINSQMDYFQTCYTELILEKDSKWRKETRNVIDAFHELKKIFSEELSKKNINLKLLSQNNKVFASLPWNQFLFVLSALIQNSIDASEENNQNLVILEVQTVKDKISIKIRDNGQGIKEAFSEKIFKAGFSLKTNKPGLGLAMSKVYVEKLMNGKIRLTSRYRPTEFQILLPTNLKRSL